MFERILVPVDGSDHAQRAVEVASDLAKRYESELILIHVLAHSGGDRVPAELKSYEKLEHVRITEWDLIQASGREILDAATKRAGALGVHRCKARLVTGDPAASIAKTVGEEQADMVVMGRRGLGDFRGLLLGSVSHKVAQAIDCSCLTIK